MTTILSIVFKNFWTFAGSIIVIWTVLGGLAQIILAIRGIKADNSIVKITTKSN